MSSTFTALPLSSGEAFLLQTKDCAGNQRTILVDGGKKHSETTRELSTILAELEPKIDLIDFVICTHSDADHSQGLWYFADDWYKLGRRIGEFWLPGRWANAATHILTDPVEFTTQLLIGAYEASILVNASKNDGRQLLREQAYREIGIDILNSEAGYARPPHDVRFNGDDENNELGLGLSRAEAEALRAELEETDCSHNILDSLLDNAVKLEQLHRLSFNRRLYHYPNYMIDGRTAFEEVAKTAKSISKIVKSALIHEIKIRWFDFGEFQKTGKASGGEENLLQPCCAVEVVPTLLKKRLTGLGLFFSLKLSSQNVESLVFYRPETELEPGVLFLGDSRLSHGLYKPECDFQAPFHKPKRRVLVTAPHHGSRVNDNAYKVLKDWLGTDQQLYIRNGGQKGQVLNCYLNNRDRRCAQCNQCYGECWKQTVELKTNISDWYWSNSANMCGKLTPKS